MTVMSLLHITCQWTTLCAHTWRLGLFGSPLLTSETKAHRVVTSRFTVVGRGGKEGSNEESNLPGPVTITPMACTHMLCRFSCTRIILQCTDTCLSAKQQVKHSKEVGAQEPRNVKRHMHVLLQQEQMRGQELETMKNGGA